MWKVLSLGLGLALSPTARSADLGESPVDVPYEALAAGPLDDAKAKAAEKKEAEDAEQAERLAALDAERSGKQARVVVLKWKGTDVDYDNDTVQRNVRTRIARPDAKFYPSIDIYQSGRRDPRRSVRPDEQRGSVPVEAIGVVMNAVQDIETLPWNGMPESDWGITANTLRGLAENEVWFVDRPELREPLFHLYIQIGRAAENSNNTAPPFYSNIGNQPVNYYWYLAGALAYEDPTLLAKVTDTDLNGSVSYYKDLLTSGEIPLMTLSFDLEDKWDAKAFATDFKTFINGREVLISDPDAFYKVPPGRVDVYLKRGDGHGLSDRILIDKLDGKIYFVREVARKAMGLDLIDQLMKHPNECTPELSGEVFHYLSVYAKLHPDSEIYVAVPEAGNPNKVRLWRFDRVTNTLQKVLDDSGSFPVRFVALAGVGASFNGATLKPIDEAAVEAYEEYQDCLLTNPDPTSCTEAPLPEYAPDFAASGIPLSVQFRGHYGRLMVAFGAEFSPSIGEGPYSDLYQTKGDHVVVDEHGAPALKELGINRLLHMSVGGFFLKDAALGFGPRGYGRIGWFNVPHMLDLTAHGGITAQPPGVEASGRVRAVLDIDGYLGALVPIQHTNREKAVPTFGISASGGITF